MIGLRRQALAVDPLLPSCYPDRTFTWIRLPTPNCILCATYEEKTSVPFLRTHHQVPEYLPKVFKDKRAVKLRIWIATLLLIFQVIGKNSV